MPKLNLTLATLGDLDGGRAGLMIDAAILRAIGDIEDRGHDGKPREVNIKLTLLRDGGDRISAEVKAGAKVPVYATAKTVGQLATVKGELGVAFQADNPRRPDQPTFDFDKDQSPQPERTGE
jgi:hypothetical protein